MSASALHIQHRADDLERTGILRAEAERRARIEFGGRHIAQRNPEKSRSRSAERSSSCCSRISASLFPHVAQISRLYCGRHCDAGNGHRRKR